MHIKFRITFVDGETMESHDEMYNQVKDHCDALPPEKEKKWEKYELISDEGHKVEVNFMNGLFTINGQRVHPANESGMPLTFQEDTQEFENSTDQWKIMNGLPYFPVVGRRHITNENGETVLYFAGWKRKMGEETVQKQVFMYPNGEIVLT